MITHHHKTALRWALKRLLFVRPSKSEGWNRTMYERYDANCQLVAEFIKFMRVPESRNDALLRQAQAWLTECGIKFETVNTTLEIPITAMPNKHSGDDGAFCLWLPVSGRWTYFPHDLPATNEEYRGTQVDFCLWRRRLLADFDEKGIAHL